MKKQEALSTVGTTNTAKTVEKPSFSLIDKNFLKSRIYTIRGIKVMLDADLAEIYGYSTTRQSMALIRLFKQILAISTAIQNITLLDKLYPIRYI